jgi:hypothetical protein
MIQSFLFSSPMFKWHYLHLFRCRVDDYNTFRRKLIFIYFFVSHTSCWLYTWTKLYNERVMSKSKVTWTCSPTIYTWIGIKTLLSLHKKDEYLTLSLSVLQYIHLVFYALALTIILVNYLSILLIRTQQ